jgi:uncharacterized repeat protein (TIGR04052 family)
MRAALIMLATAVLSGTAVSQQTVEVRFKAVFGADDFACGHTYSGAGATRSSFTPEDFRFYIHQAAMLDDAAKETPIELQQSAWQLGELALLDFEDGTGGCSNGTPQVNRSVIGTVPSGGHYRGLRFIVGVPFAVNHADLTSLPPPLDLTAMFWSWNAGHKFLRLDLAGVGGGGGFSFHLGSTGCAPASPASARPVSCVHSNLAGVFLPDFDTASNAVVVDVKELLEGVKLSRSGDSHGCTSSPGEADCAPLFHHLGLAFAAHRSATQTVFRVSK